MGDDNLLFDFPCSYTFRAYEAEQFGEHLSSVDPPKSIEQPKIIYRNRPIDDEIDQLTFEVQGWRRKHAEILSEIDKLRISLSKKRREFNQYDYLEAKRQV